MANVFYKLISAIFLFALLVQFAPAESCAQENATKLKGDTNDSSKLPTAERVLSDFVDALGGEMSIRSVEAFEIKGKVKTNTHNGTFKSLYAEGKVVTRTEYDGFATVLQGCDGENLWHLVRVGTMTQDKVNTEDKAKSQAYLAELSAHQQALSWLEFDGEISVENKTESDDQEVWELKFVPRVQNEGGKTHFGYFSVKTGLLLKKTFEDGSPESVRMIRKFEYQSEPVEGVIFWAKKSLVHGNNETVFEYETVNSMPKFSPDDFQAPDVIKDDDD